MKRIIAMLMLIAVGCMAKAQSQGYSGKYFNATQYMRSPIYFIGSSDTAASKAYARSLIVGGRYWTLSGNNIYSSNTGNVGIGNAIPSYKLDVSGNINGFNIKTNPTTYSTFIGINSGLNDNGSLHNTYIGHSSGQNNVSGTRNTFVGSGSGADTAVSSSIAAPTAEFVSVSSQ